MKYKYNMLLQNDTTSKNYFWLSDIKDDNQAIDYFIRCSKNNEFKCYGAVITCNDEQLFFVSTSELIKEPLKQSLHN